MNIAVIGGGFSGLIFSLKFLKAGADVTLYEEHLRVGYPPHCTGLVSGRVVALIGEAARKSIISRYDTLTLESEGSEVRLKVLGDVYKLDRIMLEELLLEEAEARGLKVLLGSRVSRISPRGLVEVGGAVRSYDSIILAEGYYGSLRGKLGLGYFNPPVYGVNIEYRRGDAGAGNILVSFDPQTSHKFFSWNLKVRDTILAGTGVRDPRLLKQRIRALEKKHSLSETVKTYGGPILTGPPPPKLSMGKIHVVGDAGGLNKPLTGGGLYPNSLAAELSLRLLKSVGDANRALNEALNIVAGRLKIQYKMVRLILEDNSMVKTAIDAAVQTRLNVEMGKLDYDRHEEIITRLARNPLKTARTAMEALRKAPVTTLKTTLKLLLT
ncbi:MAG: NAD(P)/FAD-dependent oxidoreductase [Thermoprotei archaeon]|nr:NAD(P)/FAD-dependent oxidoreductase [Thermoprotei archaeon]